MRLRLVSVLVLCLWVGFGSAALESCADVAAQDANAADGVYAIDLDVGSRWVYCAIDRTRNLAWTLIRSYSLANYLTYRAKSFRQDLPQNPDHPAQYRQTSYQLRKSSLEYLKARSDQFLAACNFDTSQNRDFARSYFSYLDPLAFNAGGVCHKTIAANIRGYGCTNCMTRWWQQDNTWDLHIDSPSHCGAEGGFSATPGWQSGAYSSEDNFGYYYGTAQQNPNFACTSSSSSTTNWYFGGAIVYDSCQAALDSGVTTTGEYMLRFSDGVKKGFCHFKSIDGQVYGFTLVKSFNVNNFAPHAGVPFDANLPKNSADASFRNTDYRLTATNMAEVAAESTNWLSICNFDYSMNRDYIFGSFAQLNVLTWRGSYSCQPVLKANIRGYGCTNCNALFWQGSNYELHIDSSHTKSGCHSPWTPGAYSSEDNFGYAHARNTNFACTASGTATTNWFFGRVAGNKPPTAELHGDPIYQTFDGLEFEYMGICPVLLSQTCEGENFRLVGYNTPCGLKSCVERLVLDCKDEISGAVSVVELFAGPDVVLNGKSVDVHGMLREHKTLQSAGLSVSGEHSRTANSGSHILINVVCDAGLSITWTGKHWGMSSIKAHSKTPVCGLMGNNNGNKLDDMIYQDGRQVEIHDQEILDGRYRNETQILDWVWDWVVEKEFRQKEDCRSISGAEMKAKHCADPKKKDRVEAVCRRMMFAMPSSRQMCEGLDTETLIHKCVDLTCGCFRMPKSLLTCVQWGVRELLSTCEAAPRMGLRAQEGVGFMY